MPELLSYYGYSLEIARQAGIKINQDPKTIASLVSTIQKALDHKQGCCYSRTYVSVVKKAKV